MFLTNDSLSFDDIPIDFISETSSLESDCGSSWTFSGTVGTSEGESERGVSISGLLLVPSSVAIVEFKVSALRASQSFAMESNFGLFVTNCTMDGALSTGLREIFF